MGWIEDSVEEFRKLPPAGKVAVGGAVLGVAILGYAQYRRGAVPAASGANGAPSPLSGGLGGGGGIVTTTDSAGGVWSINTPPPVSLFNGDGLPLRSLNPFATDAPTTGSSTTFAPRSAPWVQPWVQAATTTIHASATASPPAPAPAPAAASARTFIPTTIRPLPTPGRGRSI